MIPSNYTLKDLLKLAETDGDELSRKLAAYLEPLEEVAASVDSYQIRNVDDLVEYAWGLPQKTEDFQREIDELDSVVSELEQEKRALNLTINSLRYELDMNHRVKEIEALRNHIMELADVNLTQSKEMSKLQVEFVTISKQHEELQRKFHMWEILKTE